MSARDRRLAEEMARKHGTSYESASTRAARKKKPASDVHPDAWAGAAEYVRSTPKSAERRARHRAGARDVPEKGAIRSITGWFRS